ncbi:MAG: GNAT family N-acetyltransferase [Gammaproteobacteria bacterium]|nr:GNAT family N-acetyltransferase [Gammaproteobacteria bacterium]
MASEDYSIEVASWASHRETLRSIRDRVFIEEQAVPSDIEIDGRDETATHFLLTRDSVVLGCGRLLEDGKITRLALLPEYRGDGLGTALLAYIVAHAKGRGLERVYLHAQDQATAFYQRAGFAVRGEGFEEAGIPHHAMSLSFATAGADRTVSAVGYPEPFATLAVELVATARRQLRIFSPRLDHDVFDREAMRDAIAALARNSRYCDIRILISDSKPIVKLGHRLLTLAQRLPSSVHIQKLSEHPDLPDDSFVVRDSDGTLYKPLDADREGFYEPHSRTSAKRFIEQFDELWQRSRPDPELRRLGL